MIVTCQSKLFVLQTINNKGPCGTLLRIDDVDRLDTTINDLVTPPQPHRNQTRESILAGRTVMSGVTDFLETLGVHLSALHGLLINMQHLSV